eukprot:scaffold123324_cov55-Phaeocystis_antarctica.AAC.4
MPLTSPTSSSSTVEGRERSLARSPSRPSPRPASPMPLSDSQTTRPLSVATSNCATRLDSVLPRLTTMRGRSPPSSAASASISAPLYCPASSVPVKHSSSRLAGRPAAVSEGQVAVLRGLLPNVEAVGGVGQRAHQPHRAGHGAALDTRDAKRLRVGVDARHHREEALHEDLRHGGHDGGRHAAARRGGRAGAGRRRHGARVDTPGQRHPKQQHGDHQGTEGGEDGTKSSPLPLLSCLVA